MKSVKKIFYCFLILLSFNGNLSAQDTLKRKHFFWIQAGILSNRSMDGGVGFKTGAFYNHHKNIFGLAYYQGSEFNLNLFNQQKTNTIVSINNLSLIYGRSFDFSYLRITPMAGPSFGTLLWRNDQVDVEKLSSGGSFFYFPSYKYTYYYDEFRYLGLYTNLNIMVMAGRHFAIGADLFKNWHQHADNGFVIHLVFGNIRRKL